MRPRPPARATRAAMPPSRSADRFTTSKSLRPRRARNRGRSRLVGEEERRRQSASLVETPWLQSGLREPAIVLLLAGGLSFARPPQHGDREEGAHGVGETLVGEKIVNHESAPGRERRGGLGDQLLARRLVEVM